MSVKYFCDNCGEEMSDAYRHIQVVIPTQVIDKPNQSWPGNNVFSMSLCCGCIDETCNYILKPFGKTAKDVH